MRPSKFPLTIVLFLMLGFSAFAQEKFSAEFRPGISFPLNDIAGTKVGIGYGFEFTLAFEVLQDIGIYAGWGWNKFNSNHTFLTNRIDIEEIGYTAGVQFKHRIKNSKMSFLIRGGAVYNLLELENTDGDQIADSGYGIGWQAEAGITFEIGSNWDLRPTLRFRTLPGDIQVFNGQMSVGLQYLSPGVGLAKRF